MFTYLSSPPSLFSPFVSCPNSFLVFLPFMSTFFLWNNLFHTLFFQCPFLNCRHFFMLCIFFPWLQDYFLRISEVLPPGPLMGGSLFLNCIVEVNINLYLRGVNLSWSTPYGNLDQVSRVANSWPNFSLVRLKILCNIPWLYFGLNWVKEVE